MKKRSDTNAVGMFVLLLLFWMIIASELSFLQLFVGVLASGFIVIYGWDLLFNRQQHTKLTLRSLKAFIVLFFILLKEMIIANINVALIVLSPKMPISPKIVKIKQPLKKDLNRALYGNFITLTPGTLTIDTTEDYVIVHGLTEHHVDALTHSPLQKAFINFEGDKHD